MSTKERFSIKERSWILYDWANSVYATNIMAAIFPTIFVSIAGDAGDRWWGIGTSIATLVVSFLAPILGAMGDHKGMKKKLFTFFMLLGVVFTSFIALTNDWRFMLIGYIISHIGFSGANLFYDSFLTDVTTNERMDKVSSWGYAMGYIGGSTIPFVISIAVLMIMGYDNVFAQKFSILITSAWWLLFSLPFLKNVDQVYYLEHQKFSAKGIFSSIKTTLKEILSEKGMLMFILAYFFYIDGVGTVISISTAYGSALGLGAVGMILALLVTQLVAMPFSIFFGKMAQKISTRKALLIAVSVYMLISLVGFVMGYTLEPYQDTYYAAFEVHSKETLAQMDLSFENEEAATRAVDRYMISSRDAIRDHRADKLATKEITWEGISANDLAKAKATAQILAEKNLAYAEASKESLQVYQAALSRSTILFWAMAILVGTVQGGIQATSRSYFGKIIPKHRSNEYFGFFDIFGKFASVIGPALYAIISSITGRSSFGCLALLTLFLIGFMILFSARRSLDELEASRRISN